MEVSNTSLCWPPWECRSRRCAQALALQNHTERARCRLVHDCIPIPRRLNPRRGAVLRCDHRSVTNFCRWKSRILACAGRHGSRSRRCAQALALQNHTERARCRLVHDCIPIPRRLNPRRGAVLRCDHSSVTNFCRWKSRILACAGRHGSVDPGGAHRRWRCRITLKELTTA